MDSLTLDSDVVSEKLCAACNKIVLELCRGVANYWDRRLKVDFVEVYQNSLAGCVFCHLIAEEWMTSVDQPTRFEVIWRVNAGRYQNWESYELSRLIVDGELGDEELEYEDPGIEVQEVIARIQFSASQSWANPPSSDWELIGAERLYNLRHFEEAQPKIFHKINGNSGSSEVMTTITTWMSLCSSHHTCASSRETPLPTRIIDVGPANGSEPPRLLLSSAMQGPYVTLSHSWGGSLDIKLTTSNFVDYQKCIPEHTLPATFADALRTTRQLGFRHLWIDALCIIQDSLEDWEAEAAAMATIYQNSRIMLSALDSRNCNSGLFRDRDNDVLFEVRESVSRSCGFPLGTFVHLEGVPIATAIEDGPLSQRGWTLQESVLSPIVVHFSSQQVYWECQQMRASEDGKFEKIDPEHRTLRSRIGRSSDSPWIGFGRGHHEDWYKLVQEYTLRHLTFEDDRLPALIGLAKDFELHTHDTYVNGLWKTDLGIGIFWSILRDEARKKRETDEFKSAQRTEESALRAPSWSWASINGPVEWDWRLKADENYEHTVLFQILDLQPPVKRSTFVGYQTCLSIRGRVKEYPFFLSRVESSSGYFFTVNDEGSIQLYFDAESTRNHLKSCSHETHSLHAFQGIKITSSAGDDIHVCIILEPVHLVENRYRRIGMCWITEPLATTVFEDAVEADILFS